MNDFKDFRGHDLTARKLKIKRTMELVPPKTPEDIPVIAQTPCYTGFGNKKRDTSYWENPAEMLKFQQDGAELHLKRVDDDFVPYFMPWFGTGVVASAFGCKIKPATGDGDDPGVISTAVETVADIANLKRPDPRSDGYMPTVLKFMEYAACRGELPVGYTDLNSPLSTAAQLCGYEKLFYWMYDEPEAIHDLMSIICESFINWAKVQKEITGEPFGCSNGLQGVWTPKGGIWLSDDDLVSINGDLYAEFVLPHYSNIFEHFGGGHLHYCGNGTHQLGNIKNMRGVTAVNNSPMGNYAAFAKLCEAAKGKLVIEIQDAAPDEPGIYYKNLFSGLDSMAGIMVATSVEDNLAMDNNGQTIYVDRDPFKAANDVVKAVREAAACMEIY
jgi:uroporphyrinogen-III decarboxylase